MTGVTSLNSDLLRPDARQRLWIELQQCFQEELKREEQRTTPLGPVVLRTASFFHDLAANRYDSHHFVIGYDERGVRNRTTVSAHALHLEFQPVSGQLQWYIVDQPQAIAEMSDYLVTADVRSKSQIHGTARIVAALGKPGLHFQLSDSVGSTELTPEELCHHLFQTVLPSRSISVGSALSTSSAKVLELTQKFRDPQKEPVKPFSPSSQRSPVVFISYSHDSESHQESVHALAERLRRKGIQAHMDRYRLRPPQGWPQWMLQQIQQADFVLCICTPLYRERFENQRPEEEGGLGSRFEGSVITQEIYQMVGQNEKFIAILLDGAHQKDIPSVLAPYTYFSLPRDWNQLYCELTDQPYYQQSPVGQIEKMIPRAPQSDLSLFAGKPYFGAQDPILQTRIADLRHATQILPEPTLVLSAQTQEAVALKQLLYSRTSDLVQQFECPPLLRSQGFDWTFRHPAQLHAGRARRLLEPGVQGLELWDDGTLLGIAGQLLLCRRLEALSVINKKALTELTDLFVRLVRAIHECQAGIICQIHLSLLNVFNTCTMHVKGVAFPFSERIPIASIQAQAEDAPEQLAGSLLADLYAQINVEPDHAPYICWQRGGNWSVDLSHFQLPGNAIKSKSTD